MLYYIIAALIANAIAHILSFQKLKQAEDSNATGVLAFVFINALIALFLGLDLSWAKWLAIAFPAIGGLALLITTIVKGKGGWIDYTILGLDMLIIFLTVTNYF
ncbi:MAG: hypothetical protein AAF587_41605 [Bacteroidota bacterium]